MPGSGGGEEYHELREIKATEKLHVDKPDDSRYQ